MREETMLRKLRSGDPAGLEALMDRYLPYVSTVVWNILRGSMSPEDGEETASDVFLAAWEQADDPAGELERTEERALVRRALFSLPQPDQEIFLRHYYYAQSVKEIAAALDMNESTVKTRLRRGRFKLKELLTKEALA